MGITEFDGQWYNLQIVNNIVVTKTVQGIAFYGIHDSIIANNVLLSDEGGATPSIDVQNEKNGTASSNVVIRNNLMSGLAINPRAINITVDHNICVPTRGKCLMQLVSDGKPTWEYKPGSHGDNNLIETLGAQRLFTNFSLANATVTGLDLRPKPDSPAVGRGNRTDAPTTDITGALRTDPYDLGPYRFAP